MNCLVAARVSSYVQLSIECSKCGSRGGKSRARGLYTSMRLSIAVRSPWLYVTHSSITGRPLHIHSVQILVKRKWILIDSGGSNYGSQRQTSLPEDCEIHRKGGKDISTQVNVLHDSLLATLHDRRRWWHVGLGPGMAYLIEGVSCSKFIMFLRCTLCPSHTWFNHPKGHLGTTALAPDQSLLSRKFNKSTGSHGNKAPVGKFECFVNKYEIIRAFVPSGA